jgi:hypothetical protein
VDKKPLIGISICAVVLLVLASLTNVVGYQTVQTSNQKIITTEIDEKELLFQSIVHIANNKEIQRVILSFEIIGKRPFDSSMRFSIFTFPVITKRFLKSIYTMGVILFRTLDKSKIQTFIGHHHVMNQGLQKELSAVIEKDANLKSEITQLSSFSCGCKNENALTWHFPVFCTFLLILFITIQVFGSIVSPEYGTPLANLLMGIALFVDMSAESLQCDWYPLYVK